MFKYRVNFKKTCSSDERVLKSVKQLFKVRMKLFLSEFAEFTVDLSKIHNLSLNLYINTPQCTIFSERDSRSKTIERALTTLSLNCQKTSSCEFPSNHCQLSCPYLFGSIPPEGSLQCRVLDCNNYFFYSGKISCGVVYT